MRILTNKFILLWLFFLVTSLNTKGQLSCSFFGQLKVARYRFELQPIGKNELLVMGGNTLNNSVTSTCEIISFERRKVESVSDMNSPKTEFTSVINADSNVFVLGGFNGTKNLSAIDFFDKKSYKWISQGSLVLPRRQHSSILLNNRYILTIGGRDSNLMATNIVELFDISLRRSRLTAPLPYPLTNATLQITSEGKVVAFGGREGGHKSKQSTSVLMFDLNNEKWEKIGEIPSTCEFPMCIKLWNKSLLYTGGWSVEKGNNWLQQVVIEKGSSFSKIGEMRIGRHLHWLAQLDEKRVISGGGILPNSTRSSCSTDIINIENGEVTEGVTTLNCRRGARAYSFPKGKGSKNLSARVVLISGVDSKFLNTIEILDDSPTISGIINSYSSVTSVGKFPTSQIQVRDVKEFAVGDKVLIAQMQERPFSKTLSNKSLRTDFAGNHEFGRIVSINGNTIALEKQLTHHYSTLGKVQLVRVPEYGDVAVTGELTCKPWDGETGGILAFEANGTVSLQSHINVSGKGFNGAVPARETTSSLLYEDNTISTFSNTSSGEGISSSDTKMNSHTLVSNGGESGALHNSGGAGGSNTSCGGDGSLGWVSELSLNQVVASKGGKALEYNGKKVFMGGGGGAGHSDDGEIGTGGNGGGIVFISCDNLISNDYTINANGINGKECSLDGAGGGGAAGTIYLDINNLHYPLVVNAIGGNGGNSVITNPDLPPAGSGGGGAGGVLLLKKHHNTIIAHLDGGQQGIAASVFSEHKAQSGCEGMVLDNVQIVDASSDKPDHKSFIDDCLTEDCSEYKTSKIQIQEPDNQLTSETGEASIDIHASTGYVYPNPATDRVTIYGTELDVISLYDNMGNRFSLPFIKNENSTTIDVASLNNGIYFVKSRNTTLSFVITK